MAHRIDGNRRSDEFRDRTNHRDTDDPRYGASLLDDEMKRVHVLAGDKFKLSVDVETKCANLFIPDECLELDEQGVWVRRLDIDGDELKEIAAFLDMVLR